MQKIGGAFNLLWSRAVQIFSVVFTRHYCVYLENKFVIVIITA